MKLTVIGSGSKGNCYLLHDDKECLVIELGLPIKEVKKALDYNVLKIVGAVITHKHTDHARYCDDLVKMGFTIYKPFETSLMATNMGGFRIQAFPVIHDVDCFGFYIKHRDFGKLLYITDTAYVKQNFKNLCIDHMMLEVNYQDEYIDENAVNFNHKVKGHMSLNTCLEFIKSNATPNLKTITIIHMNKLTCDEYETVKRIKEIVPDVTVNVADKGLEINL